MTEEMATLGDVCRSNLLNTKQLLAPSFRVGHQWTESLVRNGQSLVNLSPTTLLRMALDLVSSDLAKDGLTLANRNVGLLVVDAIWSQLPADGYLGRLDPSSDLTAAVYDSLLSLRMAGTSRQDIERTIQESGRKAQDLALLLDVYIQFLEANSLVDQADVLDRAIATLKSDPRAIDPETLILVPAGFPTVGLERQLLELLPSAQRIIIRHPVEPPASNPPLTDVGLLRNIGKTLDGVQSNKDGSVQFFRAVGESNEVREVLRRCLLDQHQLDDVEILYTNTATYVPLIFAISRRYFAERDRPNGIPVTFADGIPTSMSRPGRALATWLQWIAEEFPQRLLVEMIAEGLLDTGDDLSAGYLVRLFRPIAVGAGSDNYLPKLDEQIESLKSLPESLDADVVAARKRKLIGLRLLHKICKQLISLSRHIGAESHENALASAETFLQRSARSVSEFDRYSADALIEQLRDRRFWLARFGDSIEIGKWLSTLPTATRVLGSGPRPGHLHMAHVGSGGHSGRQRSFVIGLDDHSFPGATLQDPILLDHERAHLSPELATSGGRLRHKIDEFAASLSRMSPSVTLSWSCHNLSEDRETFPSPVVLSAFRIVTGQHDADLESLNDAVGPPVSFAPTTAEKALDQSERWLWKLSDDNVQGTECLSTVEAFFPHLARGRAANIERSTGFGRFNGYVPQAGQDLSPFAEDSPVLSASALETAGRCPLAFFFRNGLQLHLPEELEIVPDRWLDPAQFGSLMHDVFRRFMAELTSEGMRPQFERDHIRLAKILSDTVTQWRKDVPPPNENAFRMQNWQLVRTSRIFLQSEEAFCRTSAPRFFEVALGLEGTSGESPLDDAAPAVIHLPGGHSIRARGQIDRVDALDERRFTIWDYKIGSGYGYDRADPFRQGRRVQSVLYLRMIESAIRKGLHPKAIVESFGYFFPSIRAQGLRIDWSAGDLASGMNVLERLCASIEEGAFVATDDKDDCTYCDYAAICGNVIKVTRQSKELLARGDVVQLRHLQELRRG